MQAILVLTNKVKKKEKENDHLVFSQLREKTIFESMYKRDDV